MVQTGQGRLFIKTNNGNVCTPYTYYGCMSVSGYDQSFGSVSNVYCQDPNKYDSFVSVAAIRTDESRISLTITNRLPMKERSILEKLVKLNCTFDLQVHYGECSRPKDFTEFQRSYNFRNAIITGYALSELTTMTPDGRAVVEETLSISVESVTSIVNHAPLKISYSTEATGTPISIVNISQDSTCTTACGLDCCFLSLYCVSDEFDCAQTMQLRYICGNNISFFNLDCINVSTNAKLIIKGDYFFVVSENKLYKFPLDIILNSQTPSVSCVAGAVIDDCSNPIPSFDSPDCWELYSETFKDIFSNGNTLYGITETSFVLIDDSCFVNTIETFSSPPTAISGNSDTILVTLTDGRVFQYDEELQSTLTYINGITNTVAVIDESNYLIGTQDGIYRVCGGECTKIALNGCVSKIVVTNDGIMYAAINYATGSEILISIDNGVTFAKMSDGGYNSSVFIGTTILDLAVCDTDFENFIAVGVNEIVDCLTKPLCSYDTQSFILKSSL